MCESLPHTLICLWSAHKMCESVCVCVCVCVFLLSTCLNGRSAWGVSTQTDTTHSSSICEGKEDFYCPWGYRRGHWGSAGGGQVTRRAYLKGQSVPGCSSSLTRWLNSDPPVSRRWPVPSVTLSFHGGLKFTRRQISNKINEGSLHLSIYLSMTCWIPIIQAHFLIF